MKILCIGGTYFLGKRFVELASLTHEITLINRGTRGMGAENVSYIICDRHDAAGLKEKLRNLYFDAVVDFCAYSEGDIEGICSALSGKAERYIFISTVDVYRRGTEEILNESAPFETRDFGGDAGDYISGKVALEKELIRMKDKYGIKVTSVRPVFIYGKDNYAPRESIYFNWIMKAGQYLHPKDADGVFQLVNVDDVAKALIKLLDMPYVEALNLCGKDIYSYDSFADVLDDIAAGLIGRRPERVMISIDEILSRGIPLPFPLTKEESNIYSGEMAKQLGIDFTDLKEGMKEVFGAL